MVTREAKILKTMRLISFTDTKAEATKRLNQIERKGKEGKIVKEFGGYSVFEARKKTLKAKIRRKIKSKVRKTSSAIGSAEWLRMETSI